MIDTAVNESMPFINTYKPGIVLWGVPSGAILFSEMIFIEK